MDGFIAGVVAEIRDNFSEVEERLKDAIKAISFYKEKVAGILGAMDEDMDIVEKDMAEKDRIIAEQAKIIAEQAEILVERDVKEDKKDNEGKSGKKQVYITIDEFFKKQGVTLTPEQLAILQESAKEYCLKHGYEVRKHPEA
jgi:endonuclease III-like uncharacterized protein